MTIHPKASHPTGVRSSIMVADQIDYKLIGDDLQGVIVTLDPEEAVVAEAGAMMYMQDGIRMITTLDQTGRGRSTLVDRLMSAGKRVLSGDSFFVTIFLNEATKRRDVAFASTRAVARRSGPGLSRRNGFGGSKLGLFFESSRRPRDRMTWSGYPRRLWASRPT